MAHPVSILVETFGTNTVDDDKIVAARPRGVRPPPRGHRARPRPEAADLPQDRGVRSLRPDAARVHVGARQPPRRLQERRRPLSPAASPGRWTSRSCWSLASCRTSPGSTSTFDYLVPGRCCATSCAVGSMVRVALHGRRVGGWVVALGPPDGRSPSSACAAGQVVRHRAVGGDHRPRRWASCAGEPVGCGRSWSPPVPPAMVVLAAAVDRALPWRAVGEPTRPSSCHGVIGGVTADPPTTMLAVVVAGVAARAARSVVHPSVRRRRAGSPARLRQCGSLAALHPEQWARRRRRRRRRDRRPQRGVGAVRRVCGRSWCSTSTTRRCRRSARRRGTPATSPSSAPAVRGVPCVLVSPCPTVTALHWAGRLAAPHSVDRDERDGWPIVELVDRTREEPWKRSLADVAADPPSARRRSNASSACTTPRAGPGCWPAARAGRCCAARSARPRSRRTTRLAGLPALRHRASARCARTAARARCRQCRPGVSRFARSSRRRPADRWSRSPATSDSLPDVRRVRRHRGGAAPCGPRRRRRVPRLRRRAARAPVPRRRAGDGAAGARGAPGRRTARAAGGCWCRRSCRATRCSRPCCTPTRRGWPRSRRASARCSACHRSARSRGVSGAGAGEFVAATGLEASVARRRRRACSRAPTLGRSSAPRSPRRAASERARACDRGRPAAALSAHSKCAQDRPVRSCARTNAGSATWRMRKPAPVATRGREAWSVSQRCSESAPRCFCTTRCASPPATGGRASAAAARAARPCRCGSAGCSRSRRSATSSGTSSGAATRTLAMPLRCALAAHSSRARALTSTAQTVPRAHAAPSSARSRRCRTRGRAGRRRRGGRRRLQQQQLACRCRSGRGRTRRGRWSGSADRRAATTRPRGGRRRTVGLPRRSSGAIVGR